MIATLLTTDEVATFVARGVLEFPGVIPDDLNTAASEELRRIMASRGSPDRPVAPSPGDAWADIYPEPSAVGAVLRHPAVQRVVDSLVGPEAVCDHDGVYSKPAGDITYEPLHADAVIDPTTAFDVQIFYFPHDVQPAGGGTGFVPGTHLRRVHASQVGRYGHIRGERQWAGPAGSVLVFHHGLWHRGTGNSSSTERLLYKIRLDPTCPQTRRWDTRDLPDRQHAPTDPTIATFDTGRIAMTLRHREAWMGEHDHRLELIARAKLWRYLIGDEAFSLDWYRSRIDRRSVIRGAGA